MNTCLWTALKKVSRSTWRGTTPWPTRPARSQVGSSRCFRAWFADKWKHRVAQICLSTSRRTLRVSPTSASAAERASANLRSVTPITNIITLVTDCSCNESTSLHAEVLACGCTLSYGFHADLTTTTKSVEKSLQKLLALFMLPKVST